MRPMMVCVNHAALNRACKMNVVSPNFNDRHMGQLVDMLVIHYTGMESEKAATDNLCNSTAAVSAHYIIGQDGSVNRLVDEDKRAWHAGVAWWRGALDINSRSIGIELVNPGHEFGYQPFPEKQLDALISLSKAILRRHHIPARNIVGHSDVAPMRKSDPGELFDWQRLAKSGIGLWPSGAVPMEASLENVTAMLSAYGYETVDLPATIAAFQRHFRAERVDGIADGQTIGRLAKLLDLTLVDDSIIKPA